MGAVTHQKIFSTAILKFSVSEGPSLEEIDMRARYRPGRVKVTLKHFPWV